MFYGAVMLNHTGDRAIHMPKKCSKDHTQGTGSYKPSSEMAHMCHHQLFWWSWGRESNDPDYFNWGVPD